MFFSYRRIAKKSVNTVNANQKSLIKSTFLRSQSCSQKQKKCEQPITIKKSIDKPLCLWYNEIKKEVFHYDRKTKILFGVPEEKQGQIERVSKRVLPKEQGQVQAMAKNIP